MQTAGSTNQRRFEFSEGTSDRSFGDSWQSLERIFAHARRNLAERRHQLGRACISSTANRIGLPTGMSVRTWWYVGLPFGRVTSK